VSCPSICLAVYKKQSIPTYYHPKLTRHSCISLTTDGAKQGMTAEGAKAAARSAKQLSVQEANQILGIESTATWEEIMKKYNHLFQQNEKHGSFYLQSKIYRAKERLEEEFKEQGLPMPEVEVPPAEDNTNEQPK
jgi:import inner membrane translocase subunit TIM16